MITVARALTCTPKSNLKILDRFRNLIFLCQFQVGPKSKGGPQSGPRALSVKSMLFIISSIYPLLLDLEGSLHFIQLLMGIVY